ncbi:hypothetical protein POSPLADRAFT_1129069 [Postia placenta MAD-698-R-SB12]|uniref:H/ACA ribonucleoprotein complex non-core subunit NAF1 n=1 Tax=Postia placenta MAD-698-R-SB12 TaxID=670580 RepID=A0A1X6NFD9_9APHY|nr:hypothetical protein POSPLADRAFT_1129069 [Postia placenta MAD-698-R-SB12]OSX67073.1 hypothetical protein POSPLADRAFT_1129069 [Postia placenta MAD-698-R-SB12]
MMARIATLTASGNAPPSVSATDSGSSSDSDVDSHDSDSDEKAKKAPPTSGKLEMLLDDEDETGPAVTSEAQTRTKNEIPETEAKVIIPDIEEVGSDEVLEKVGEVMSIFDKVVIVKGSASEYTNRASERALDSDTLLVFEDRKVLGYIYETFGPTSQPLYQIKFNEKYPLNPERVQLSRPVFHVPQRSNFVFVGQLRRLKGSDASNVYDEEPADEELDFSDDEAEAAHKRALTERRRGQSVTSSRHATPTPSQMRDQDMADDSYGANPYDTSGPYNDMDFGAGPSRPAPIPYDDPYSDSYGVDDAQLPSVEGESRSPVTSRRREDDDDASIDGHINDRGRGRGRNRYPPGRDGGGRRDDRGRGRGRDRPRGNRGRGRGRGRDDRGPWAGHERGRQPSSFSDAQDAPAPRPLSPTSLAIARATGQYADGTAVGSDAQSQASGWSHPQYTADQQYNFSFGYQNQYVQPHINPRFASNFGMNFGFQQGNQYMPYGYNGVGYSGGGNPSWDQEYSRNTGAQRLNNGGGSPRTEEPTGP